MSDEVNDPDYPSLSIVLKFTQEGLADQIAQSGTLDGKANFVLSAATTLIGTVLTLQTVLPFPVSFRSTRLIIQIVLLVLYLATMVSAFVAYWLRTYKVAPNPAELAETYSNQQPRDTNRAIGRAMVDAFRDNDQVIQGKIIWLEVAFVLLILEALGSVILLFLQFIYKLFP